MFETPGLDELPNCGEATPRSQLAVPIPRTGRRKCTTVATRAFHEVVITWARAQLAGDLDSTAAKMPPMFGLG